MVAAQSCSPVFASNSSETVVDRRPNKYNPAGGHDRAAKVRRASCRRLQLIHDSKWDLPAISPLFTSTALSVPQGGFWHGHWCSIPEASIFTIFGRPPILLRCASNLRFHRSNGPQLICVDKQIAGTSIKEAPDQLLRPMCRVLLMSSWDRRGYTFHGSQANETPECNND